MVRAESPGIELRSTEKFGPAVLEFRNYLGEFLADLSAYDSTQVKTLVQFASSCPLAYEYLKTEADAVRYAVADYRKRSMTSPLTLAEAMR